MHVCIVIHLHVAMCIKSNNFFASYSNLNYSALRSSAVAYPGLHVNRCNISSAVACQSSVVAYV